ncbi:MAG: IspD/TarI family cytidylyltransferase [Leptospiraceae bacterium]|nr:IspD/TarI family cytidylyltransferase [Leptospiraceae bacterium]
MNYIYGIILSGGTGTRMSSSVPKQFLKLKNEELLRHSVKAFQNWGLCKSIVVVANEEHIKQTEEILSDLLSPNDRIVTGGNTRHASTLLGLSAINFSKNDVILIHDGARPFLSDKELHEITNEILKFGSATLASKVSETVVSSNENKVEKILDRDSIWLIKTPQGLHSSLLELLLKQDLESEPTDLCSWTESIGVKPRLIASNPFNLKITFKEDLELAESYWNQFIQWKRGN